MYEFPLIQFVIALMLILAVTFAIAAGIFSGTKRVRSSAFRLAALTGLLTSLFIGSPAVYLGWKMYRRVRKEHYGYSENRLDYLLEVLSDFVLALPFAFTFVFYLGLPLAVLALIARWITIWRMGARLLPGHCFGCGYDLTGNVSGRCPECGKDVPH